jgi:4-amino-4-deoxy-L-arabinose transferase-like glycosyltransferase
MMRLQKHWLLFVPILLVYGIGLFTDIMAVDAAQYSAMSAEMLKTGNYLQLYYRGEDYIDKPPLIFWVSALSFKVFGISNFSYKLPSVLFTLLGLFATYRVSKLLYNAKTGFYAALILASCQAWFLINHDIKTDTILAACTIVAIWQLVAFLQTQKIIYILYAALGIAGAMLTKGPIGLMVPALAIGTHLLLRREWKFFLRWEWVLLLVVVGVLLSPMLYGLYKQFDASQGKQTYNGVITSGLRFYFWTQSFGRLTGESTWKNQSDPFFFIHTFLWAFLPWSVFFLVALWKQLKRFWKNRFLLSAGQEAVTLGGIIFPIVAFSFSHYKLPHYIFVVMPLAAILTGEFMNRMLDKMRYTKLANGLRILQTIVASLLLLLVMVLCSVNFPMTNFTGWFVCVGAMVLIFYFCFKGKTLTAQLLLPSFIAIVSINFILNTHFYPTLFTYQSGSVASKLVKDSYPTYPLVGFRVQSYSLDFYYQQEVPSISDLATLQAKYKGTTLWIFTDLAGNEELKKADIKIVNEKILNDYHISMLKASFLHPDTREKVVDKNFLLLVNVN